MYRINLVLIVILSVAVIGTGAFLALEKKSSGEADQARVQKLIRNLTDPDPDLRAESEAELKKMGYRVADPLRAAAKSDNAPLAERARKLLNEIEGARTPSDRPEVSVEKKGEPAPESDRNGAGLEILLETEKPEVHASEMPRFRVRFVNRGAAPVVFLRERLKELVTYAKFARFVLVDKSGHEMCVSPETWTSAAPLELDAVVVAPGAALDLYEGQGDSKTSFGTRLARGDYRIRFVYDASAGSSYRASVPQAARAGSPLPPEKFMSNEVALVVAD